MKKRTITLVAVVAAISMLSFAVFAGNDTYAGYESFKDLLRNEKDVEAEQGQGTLVILDNGQEIVSVSGEFAGDKDSKEGYGHFTIQTDDLNKTLEVFGQDDTMYLVDGNDVYQADHDEEMDDKRSHGKRNYDGDKTFDSKSEALMDILMADFKDDFTLEGDNIVFELTQEEMPALLNLLASSDMDKDHRDDQMHEDMMDYPLFNDLRTIKDLVPELTDLEIEYIKITLIVSDNQVSGMESHIIVNGLDENSETHRVEVMAAFNQSDVEMKTFDLTDETVYEIQKNR